MTPTLTARDIIAARWTEALGSYWSASCASEVAQILVTDPSLDPRETCRAVLVHGRDALGIVLRSAQLEALADVGAKAWRETIGGK